MNTNAPMKYGSDTRRHRIQEKRMFRWNPNDCDRKMHRVGNDEDEDFDPTDYIKAFNAGSRIE